MQEYSFDLTTIGATADVYGAYPPTPERVSTGPGYRLSIGSSTRLYTALAK